ncbi:MAG: RnfH family protein [Betaproteobacteria bacterium]
MRVEVVYALADVQEVVVLDLPVHATAGEAVAASGLPAELKLGISGKRVAAGQRLQDGDRVEILRPLAADPNEARRGRARRSRRR